MEPEFYFITHSFSTCSFSDKDDDYDDDPMEVETGIEYKAILANWLTRTEIDNATTGMEKSGKVVELNDSHKHKLCLYKPNKPNGYPQVDITRFLEPRAANDPHPLVGKKVVVHHIYWRAANNYQLVTPGMHVSHLTSNSAIVSCTTLETPLENESRKFCKSLHWREDGRCPHRPIPCCPIYSIDPKYQ